MVHCVLSEITKGNHIHSSTRCRHVLEGKLPAEPARKERVSTCVSACACFTHTHTHTNTHTNKHIKQQQRKKKKTKQTRCHHRQTRRTRVGLQQTAAVAGKQENRMKQAGCMREQRVTKQNGCQRCETVQLTATKLPHRMPGC